jgi:two-component system nitrogen regulation response regulator GlnG
MRRGRFEQADGGTLFLDEIGDMSVALQVRLLRVLAEGEFYRVGGSTPIRVDVRVIAATHQDLDVLVKAGLFREDLLHRLNVIRIRVPSLRDRPGDIPELLTHYLATSARELGVEPKSLTTDARNRLVAFAWPGNVRQLVNATRRLTVTAPGREIQGEDVPPDLGGEGAGIATTDDWCRELEAWAARHLAGGGPPLLDVATERFERTLAQAALERVQGRRQEAARLIGWGRNTLTRKLRELGLE